MNTDLTLLVLGCGKMGGALLQGALKAGLPAQNVRIVEKSEEIRRDFEKKGIKTAESPADFDSFRPDVVFVALKPFVVGDVLPRIKPFTDRGAAVLSIVAGKKIAFYEDILGHKTPVVRAMPNTPALVGSGVFLFEETNSLTAEELAEVKTLFSALGKVFVLPSAQMGVGGAITGCGPAFVDLMIEAFADAGVLYGLPRDKALAMTSAMIEGSAKLQKETGTHPGVLKDMVCSPGGSTIRGVAALEDAGFRAVCISAIRAIMK